MLWVAPCLHDVAGFVAYDRMALVHTFQKVAAPDLNQINRISHLRPFCDSLAWLAFRAFPSGQFFATSMPIELKHDPLAEKVPQDVLVVQMGIQRQSQRGGCHYV